MSWQVEVQCLLLLEVLGGSHKHAVDGAMKKLTKLWKEVREGLVGGRLYLLCPSAAVCFTGRLLPLQNPGLVEQYFSAILSLEPNQNYAGMLGLLVQFCTNHKDMDVVNQHKASVQRSESGLAARGLGKEWDLLCPVASAFGSCESWCRHWGDRLLFASVGNSHAPNLC